MKQLSRIFTAAATLKRIFIKKQFYFPAFYGKSIIYSTTVFTLSLLFAVACNAPEHRHTSDGDFNALLAKSKKHVEHYPDSALTILRELLLLQQGEDKAANRGKTLNLIGSAYDTKGMYDSATHYYYEALRLAEEIHNDTLQMSVYTNLGILQFEMNNADEAIKYYQQSLIFAEKLKDSIAIAKQLNNIGNAYMTRKKDLKSAIPYFEQCVEIGQQIGYDLGVKVAGINLAMMYNEIGEPDKAMREAQKIIYLYGPNIYADFTVAQSFHKKKQYREAIRLYAELLQKPLNSREFELAILIDIVSAYQSLNDLDNAIKYLEKSYALRDSLHNIQTEEVIHKMKISYETEKKEMQITTLQQEKHLIIWLVIAGGTVLLLTLAVFFFLWRWTVQKKRFADSQKEAAEQQVKQLEQEKRLIATQAVLDGEVQERIRLARDLHDSLGSILAVAKYNLIRIKQISTFEKDDLECYNKTLNLLDDSMDEMRRVAHHLMPQALSRFGLKPSISDFCDAHPAVQFAWYGEESRLDVKLEEVIYRIIHELISNALKHSCASHIFVQIIQEPNRIAFTVQDDGRGFDPKTVITGMGLSNIRIRVASFGGTINIDSKTGEGTEINIEFPLKVEDTHKTV